MKLSIIIPVFNEEKTIVKIVGLVKAANIPHKVEKEIVVVDDFSEDNTKEKLKKLKGIKTVLHKQNNGKGFAVRTGIKNSSGDVILIQDADLEYNPSDYLKLLNPIVQKKAEVVYGTRLKSYPLKLTGSKRTPLVAHFLGNKFLSLITSLLFGQNVSDMETGYKVFNRSVLNGIKLTSKRFEFEAEITAKILKKGIKIYEVPIKVVPRGYDEGKKITWKDGITALWALFKYRFVD